jgi:hypothetical protein
MWSGFAATTGGDAMSTARLVMDGDSLAIIVDVTQDLAPQIRQWKESAERARKQWEESQWYLGEARAAVGRLDGELRSVGEAYHELQQRLDQTLADLEELRKQRDEANWCLGESRAAEEALHERIRQVTDEMLQAQDTIEALLRYAQETEERLDAERARRRALEAELVAVRAHGERRRAARRHRADVLVELQAPDGAVIFRGPSRNVSATGVSIASDRSLDAPELVQVRLHVSGTERPIEAVGRLAWQARNGTCLVGCQLLDLPTGCLDSLEQALGNE